MEWLLVAIFGSGLIAMFLSTGKNYINVFSKRFSSVAGHVTGYINDRGVNNSDGGDLFHLVVEFYINKKRFTFIDSTGSRPVFKRKGDKVKVYYNKSNPSDAFLIHITGIIITILTFVVFCFCLSLALSK